MRGLTRLSHLNLTGATGIISLEPLKGLTKLSYLDLTNAIGVTSLQPLKGMICEYVALGLANIIVLGIVVVVVGFVAFLVGAIGAGMGYLIQLPFSSEPSALWIWALAAVGAIIGIMGAIGTIRLMQSSATRASAADQPSREDRSHDGGTQPRNWPTNSNKIPRS